VLPTGCEANTDEPESTAEPQVSSSTMVPAGTTIPQVATNLPQQVTVPPTDCACQPVSLILSIDLTKSCADATLPLLFCTDADLARVTEIALVEYNHNYEPLDGGITIPGDLDTGATFRLDIVARDVPPSIWELYVSGTNQADEVVTAVWALELDELLQDCFQTTQATLGVTSFTDVTGTCGDEQDDATTTEEPTLFVTVEPTAFDTSEFVTDEPCACQWQGAVLVLDLESDCSVTNQTLSCQDPALTLESISQISVVAYDANYDPLDTSALTGNWSNGDAVTLEGTPVDTRFVEVYFVGMAGLIPTSAFWSVDLEALFDCNDEEQPVAVLPMGRLVRHNSSLKA